MKLDKWLLFSVMATLFLLCSIPLQGEENLYRRVDPAKFMTRDQFVYFEDKVNLDFELILGRNTQPFSAIIFSGESSKKNEIFLLIDGSADTNALNLFFSRNKQVVKERLVIDSVALLSRTIPVSLILDMKHNRLTCSIKPGDTLSFEDAGLSFSEGFYFKIPVDSVAVGQQPPTSGLYLRNLSITAPDSGTSGNSIYWYIIIGVVDIAIFVIMYLIRKRKKRSYQHTEEPLQIEKTTRTRPNMPHKSSIYLFGGLRIYNKQGEDIAKRFSPILKELLTLLIVHSDKKGISSDKLKQHLWKDKTLASARNNRAVNIAKLRTLLAEVGNFQINSDDGYWSIDPQDQFIDYLSFRAVLSKPGVATCADIEYLSALASEGNILPEQNYEWLDEFKGNVSDMLFDKFLGFTDSAENEKYVDLYISIADVMFKFETIHEQALSIKCRAYYQSGRHSAAKVFYDKFCEEYLHIYGEQFPITFQDILK